jgi:hypothetical protein
MYKFNGKPGTVYKTELDEIEEMKLNYNCPADEKSGEGPGSCSGSSGKSPLEEQPGLNRFAVTTKDGKKYSFRDKDFAGLAIKQIEAGKPVTDIVKRHDELYSKIDAGMADRKKREAKMEKEKKSKVPVLNDLMSKTRRMKK